MTLSSTADKKYRNLDKIVRSMNKNQTNGILAGPLVSQCLAEALLTKIDEQLKSLDLDFVRYADDYEIFIYDKNKKSKAGQLVADVLADYGFSLNNEKEKYTEFPYYILKNLEKIISQYSSKNTPLPEDTIELFNTFFLLEKDGLKGAVRFLIKSMTFRPALPQNELSNSFLIDVLANDSRSLTKACELIIKNKSTFLHEKRYIEIIVRLLNQYIDEMKDLEAVWLLYLLKELGVPSLEQELIKKIIHSGNELAIIILLHDYESSLTDENRDDCINNAKSWLLLYELFHKDFIKKICFRKRLQLNKYHTFYAQLKRRSFSFYNKTASPLIGNRVVTLDQLKCRASGTIV